MLKLLSTQEEGNKKEQLLPLIHASVDTLSRTINGLIEIIQAQHKDKHLAQSIDLQQTVDRLMQEYTEKFNTCQGSLQTNFTAVPAIYYNEAYLESILRNLISNALKYSSPHRPLELLITSQKAGEFLLISVKDNGIGMELDKVKDKLFLPFNRFSQRAEGTGIGLHLVKNMVERNGGYISVESQPDMGTTFRVFLKEYQ